MVAGELQFGRASKTRTAVGIGEPGERRKRPGFSTEMNIASGATVSNETDLLRAIVREGR
jgi:hypothetical protein